MHPLLATTASPSKRELFTCVTDPGIRHRRRWACATGDVESPRRQRRTAASRGVAEVSQGQGRVIFATGDPGWCSANWDARASADATFCLLRLVRHGVQQAPVPHDSTTGAILRILSARDAALSVPPRSKRVRPGLGTTAVVLGPSWAGLSQRRPMLRSKLCGAPSITAAVCGGRGLTAHHISRGVELLRSASTAHVVAAPAGGATRRCNTIEPASLEFRVDVHVLLVDCEQLAAELQHEPRTRKTGRNMLRSRLSDRSWRVHRTGPSARSRPEPPPRHGADAT